MQKDRDDVIKELIDIQYTRNEMDFKRGSFRVKGDVLEILPVSTFEDAVRVEFFGDEIDRIVQVDVLTGEMKATLNFVAIFPASHYVVPQEKIEKAAHHLEEGQVEQHHRERNEDDACDMKLTHLFAPIRDGMNKLHLPAYR